MKVINADYPYYKHKYISNIKELLEFHLKDNSHNIAFSYKDKKDYITKTFNEVYEDATSLSNYFYKNYKNEHIALMGENCYQWIIFYFAIILSGNIVVVIDKDSDKELLKNLMKNSDTKNIVYSDNYCSFVGSEKYKSIKIEDMDKLINLGKKLTNKFKIENEKEAMIFFTSGTTGPNKGVVLSNKNITSNIIGACSIFKLSGSVVSVLPYHHAFGLITSVLKPFYYGKEVFINSSLKYVVRDLKTVKPETLFVVPLFVETFYKQIWKGARKSGKDKVLKTSITLSNALLKIGIDLRSKLFKSVIEEFGGNLKYIICGGAYLDTKYVTWFRSIGIEILNGYGITECSPVVSVNRNNYHRDGSIGQLCKGIDIKIIDDEICVKGDSVMLGYYKDKKATKEVLIDGYFHTGDLGYIDDDGFLFVTGRKKNLIILSNGENVSPELIEGELIHDEAVCEAVVFENDGKIIASIFPNEDYIGDQEYFDNLVYKFNENKPKNHQIAYVILRTKEFIKNNNKKILRNKVMEEE